MTLLEEDMDITLNVSPWVIAIVACYFAAHLVFTSAPAKGGAK